MSSSIVKINDKKRFLSRLEDGFLMGKVKILRDIELTHPFEKNLDLTARGNTHNRKLLPLLTVWPYFAYRIYDPHFMMKKINEQLHNWANISRPSASNSGPSKIKEVQESIVNSPPINNNEDENEEDDGERGLQIKKTVVSTIA